MEMQNYIISIRSYLQAATIQEIEDGLNWYKEAYQIAKAFSSKYGISLEKAAGIISAYSINNGWALNVAHAETFIAKNLHQGLSLRKEKAKKVKLAPNSKRNIFQALESVSKAYKVQMFFINILEPNKTGSELIKINKSQPARKVPRVTIDKHATAIANFGVPLTKLTKGHNYADLAQAYAEVAKEAGMLPHQVQAITWIVYRRMRNISHYG